MRIAILQRDPVMRQSIEKILTSAGHTCAGYDDGLTMSKTLARSTVDLLVLDWHGTRLSGTEVLRTARAVGGDRMPVIFVSRDTSEESMVRAFVNGADDYASLPLRPAEFRERVTALLRRAYPERFGTARLRRGTVPLRHASPGRHAARPAGRVVRHAIPARFAVLLEHWPRHVARSHLRDGVGP